MGKKSRRRIGKSNKQKTAKKASIGDEAAHKDEEFVPQQVDGVLTFAGFDTLASLSNTEEEFDSQSTEESIDLSHLEAFHEFMMWSLSEKVDLTPKKFERTAIAKMVIEGHIL